MKTLTCVECGTRWTVPVSTGRYPQRCEKCRGENARERNRRATARYIKRWPDRHRARAIAYHEANRDRINEYRRGLRRKKPEMFRNQEMRTRYGIGLVEYDVLLEAQGGVCPICGALEPKPYGFHVDHDHKTGAVRGLLCGNCNTACGLVQDDPVRLRAAADYLEARRDDYEAANRG